MVRILVADDHPLIRKGLRQIFEGVTDMAVTGEAENGREVLKKVQDGGFDVVVLDIGMPGKSGIDILKEIKEEAPRLPVLVLSAHGEDKYALRAIRAGASGYLTKGAPYDELIEAVKKLSKGGRYISVSLAERLACAFETDQGAAPHESLSDREFQILCMIASGKTVREIAEELCLSAKTVGTYRSRIMEKMALKNHAEMTYYAMKHGLID